MRRDGRGGRGEGMACCEDVLVTGAAAFGGDDVGVVGSGDFVNDAHETFGPGGVWGGSKQGGLFGWTGW